MKGPRTAVETADLEHRLATGTIELRGRIADASNLALLVEIGAAPEDPREPQDAPERPGAPAAPLRAVYKPIRGERPLWDFPEGTLAGREVASARLAAATGYAVVPPTVLRDGPLGPGSVQLWIGDPFADDLGLAAGPVQLLPRGGAPAGWRAVLDGQLSDGTAVTLVHEDRDDLRDAAVLDAVLNNSDRKGSHLVRDRAGTLWGFDHGLTLHAEPKLRTVLWGWAGEPLRPSDLHRLGTLRSRLADPADPLTRELAELLPAADLQALAARVAQLRGDGIHPRPGAGWPAIPWPAM